MLTITVTLHQKYCYVMLISCNSIWSFWGCFLVCNGAWGTCRCLIRQSSTVAEDFVLFIAVTATGRIWGLSAQNVSWLVSVISHCCILCNHNLDMNQLGNGNKGNGWKATGSSHCWECMERHDCSCCSGDSNKDVQDKNLEPDHSYTLKSNLCHKFG